LSTAALDNLVQQGDLRPWRIIIFAKIQLAQAPQQWLRQLTGWQGGQGETDLLLQRGELMQHLSRLQCRIMFGGNPQRCLEDSGRFLVKTGKTILAWAHYHLCARLGCNRLGERRPVLRWDLPLRPLGFS
jgi:hypothetical protein